VQHWGRTGTKGQTQITGPGSKDAAMDVFMAKFKEKAGFPVSAGTPA
jgi:predicted DNA-binding WGR domain protein